jgi:hypothetical protein
MTVATPFTAHIRDLLARREPSAANTAQVWEVLSQFARRELRSRGLLNSVPGVLGFTGASWSEEPFQDLVTEVYTRAVITRLNSYAPLLDLYPNLTPLVRGNVGRAICELQRKHDPVGFSIRSNARGAVRAAVQTGALHATPPLPPLRSTTRLEFMPITGGPLAEECVLEGVLQCEEDHQGDLVHICRPGPVGRAWIRSLLDRFPPSGVLAIVFGNLISVLDRQGRLAWNRKAPPAHATEWDGEDSTPELVRWIRDAQDFEHQDAYGHLSKWLVEAINGCGAQQRVIQNLLRCVEALQKRIRNGETPRQVDISQDTGLSAQLVSELFKRLARLLETYQTQQLPETP